MGLHLIDGNRRGCVKYHRITGNTDAKRPYDRAAALDAARQHATAYVASCHTAVAKVASSRRPPPIIVAAFDAELFGHFWFEGIDWLEQVAGAVAFSDAPLRLCSASEYLRAHPASEVCAPALSSWDEKGYSEPWVNISNDWIYKHLFNMRRLMVAAARDYPSPTALQRRGLNQMGRELLLAEASDWAFIMTMRTTDRYAIRRTREHVSCFLRLHEQLREERLDAAFLLTAEERDCLFPDFDYRMYHHSTA